VWQGRILPRTSPESRKKSDFYRFFPSTGIAARLHRRLAIPFTLADNGRMRTCLAAAHALAMLVASVSARAEPSSTPSTGDKPSPELEQLTTWRPSGITYTVGGGPGVFANETLRDRATGAATVYEIRGAFGTNSPVAIELAHFGMVQRFALSDGDVRLLALGGEASMRVHLLPRSAVRPFVFGGVGFTHLNLLEAIGNQVGEDDRKNAVHFPIGAGLAVFFGNFVFDVRALARLTTESENRLFSEIDDANLSTWAATAQIGWHIP